MENSALLCGQEMAALNLNKLVERGEAGPKDVIDFLWSNECTSASNHFSMQVRTKALCIFQKVLKCGRICVLPKSLKCVIGVVKV